MSISPCTQELGVPIFGGMCTDSRLNFHRTFLKENGNIFYLLKMGIKKINNSVHTERQNLKGFNTEKLHLIVIITDLGVIFRINPHTNSC